MVSLCKKAEKVGIDTGINYLTLYSELKSVCDYTPLHENTLLHDSCEKLITVSL